IEPPAQVPVQPDSGTSPSNPPSDSRFIATGPPLLLDPLLEELLDELRSTVGGISEVGEYLLVESEQAAVIKTAPVRQQSPTILDKLRLGSLGIIVFSIRDTVIQRG